MSLRGHGVCVGNRETKSRQGSVVGVRTGSTPGREYYIEELYIKEGESLKLY